MGKVGELFREGLADVSGLSEQVTERNLFEAALLEAGADARLLARKVEDADWTKLGPQGAYFQPTREQRETQVERAYRFYFNDPIIRRTCDLITFYTFANGVPKPSYRENVDDSDADEQRGATLIDNFWADEFNQETLTKVQSQHMKSLELQLQGNVFLLLFLDTSIPIVRGERSPLQLSDMTPSEIVDVIPHPGAKKVPVYYKRVFRPRWYDFASDVWREGNTEVTRYYRHWRHRAPTTWQGQPWGPPAEKIGEGVVYHIAVNRVSEMRFGITELNSYLKWAAGLNEYMTSRMSTVMAIAQIALQAKTKGGPRNVSQIASELQDITRLAQQVEGAASLQRIPAQQGRTKAAVSSSGVTLEPTVQDTGAAGAATDVQVFKGQTAAGSGVPVHHLGDIGSANLATATSMDAPLQRLIEARQQLWRDSVHDIIGYMLSGYDLDADRLEVTMPPILARDFSLVASGLAGMLTTVDPGISSRDLVRWYVGEVLDAMGKRNTQELLDKFFPTDWVPPAERAMQQQLALAAAQGGQDPEVAAAAGAEAQADAATTAEQNGRGASYYSRGTTRGPDQRGTDDLGDSCRHGGRATRERALESEFVEANGTRIHVPAGLTDVFERFLAAAAEDEELTGAAGE